MSVNSKGGTLSIARREPNSAKSEIRYTLGQNQDSDPIPTSVESRRVLGIPNPENTVQHTPAATPLPDSPLNTPICESPPAYL